MKNPTAAPDNFEPQFEIEIGEGLWLKFADGCMLNLGDVDKALEKFADVMAQRDFGE